LDFTLTENQRAIRDLARRFAQEIEAREEELEGREDLLQEAFARMGERKLTGMIVPEAYGGAGKDQVSHVLCLMEAAKASPAVGAVAAANHAFYCFPILAWGSHEQKNTYLRPCVTGVNIGCCAFAEDEGDTEPSRVHAKATENSLGWLLNGRKRFVVQGHIASYAVFVAQADGERGGPGLSSLVVRLEGKQGFRKGKVEESLDILASRSAEMIFENVQIPHDALLGRAGEGMDHLKCIQQESWMGIAALAVGIGRAVQEKSLAWVRKRQVSKKSVASDQGVQWRLADMATELDAAELLTLRPAWLKDHGKPYEKEAAMARIFASDAAMRASSQGAEIMGGVGGESSLEKHMRSAKMCQVSMGSSGPAAALVAWNLTKTG
jgi:alkylation response protein AidB-like acyl-CoA dehydrogenase